MHNIGNILESNLYELITKVETKNNFFKYIYSCDLLSAVIKHGIKQPVLITQINSITTLGVASMLDLPAVILTEGKVFDQVTIDKANEEDIAIIYTTLTASDVVIDLNSRKLI